MGLRNPKPHLIQDGLAANCRSSINRLSGSVLGSIILWRNKKNFKTQLPFGPYIIAATFIYILIGPQMIAQIEKIAMHYLKIF